MTRAVPEYSPRMLKAFLRLGAEYRWLSDPKPSGRDATVKRYMIDIRRQAGVTVADFELAWAGKLKHSSARGKLWAVLNVYPSDLGVLLLDDGGQEVVE